MIVVDTSLVLQWLLPDEGTAAAETLVGEVLAARDAIFLEAANVPGKKVRASEMSVEQAHEGLSLIAENVARVLPSRPLLTDAIRLSAQMSHPVYDCVFLACALHLGTRLATRDGRFRSRAETPGYASSFAALPR